jgi:hypothetical protein
MHFISESKYVYEYRGSTSVTTVNVSRIVAALKQPISGFNKKKEITTKILCFVFSILQKLNSQQI